LEAKSFWEDKDLGDCLNKLAVEGDDPKDGDWLLQQPKKRKKAYQ